MIRIIFTLLAIAALQDVHAAIPQRLVGGKKADIAEVPYQVSLRVQGQHFCGGALIGKSHVLTAAHCIHPMKDRLRSVTVVVGVSALNQAGQSYRVAGAKMHPSYKDGVSWMNDIGVITLASEVKLSSNVALISLPTEDPVAGTKALASGWGSTVDNQTPVSNSLQKLTLTVIDRQQCQKSLRYYSNIESSHVCTFVKKGAGTCSGDSGGPLVANSEIIGVVSGGIPCAIGYPDVFTSVYEFRDWVKSQVGK